MTTGMMMQSFEKFSRDYADVPIETLIRTSLSLLRPHAVVSKNKRRFGKAFDGGYVLLEDAYEHDVVYSLGISDDVSFDLEMAEAGSQIYQYDHTIDRLPHEHENFHWRRLGIAHDDALDPQLRRLDTLMKENGHDRRTGMLLKMDIEGWEWPVFQTINASTLAQFRQIALEIHWEHHDKNRDQALLDCYSMRKLTANHCVFHVHGNNNGPMIEIGGMTYPSVIELSLANRADYDFVVTTESYPGPLDMPCTPGRDELTIGRFVF